MSAYREHRNRPAITACAVLACLQLGFGAGAQAQTPAEAKCRADIAKLQIKYVASGFSAVSRCHGRRSAGDLSLSIDCNDLGEPIVQARTVRSAQKLRTKISAPDGICAVAGGLFAQYRNCPPPAAASDNGGATGGIDDFLEVADCLIDSDDALLGPALSGAMGAPASTLSAVAADCQRALGKGLAKLVRTYGKVRRQCQKRLDKEGLGLDYACGNPANDPKIGRALVKLNDAIVKRCSIPQGEIDSIGACGSTVSELRDCVGDIIGPILGETLIALAYELDPGGVATTTTTITVPPGSTTTTTLPGTACGDTFPTCNGSCPAGQSCADVGGSCQCLAASGPCEPAIMKRVIRGKHSMAPPTATNLSVGWSGSTHNIDIPDLTGDSVDAVCDADCENCTTSLFLDPEDPFINCRCASDSTAGCSVVNGPDPANCSGLNNNCVCYFGSPLAISSGGTPVCVVNQINEDYTGTFDLRTGEWESAASLSSIVHLGLSQTQPCPICNGDLVANDGIRDGSCSGGLGGGACDTNGIHLTFGPTSFDCLPNAVQNISGSGLQLKLEFSTGTQTLESNLPCDAPGGNCPCRVCSGDSNVGCSSNADCAEVGAGTCTAGGGAGVQPNECNDRICSVDGVCEAGPSETFCDGVTHPDGTGFITCITDVDCSALGAGSCSQSRNRRCFPDPIVVVGSPDPTNPVLSTAFCIPPTTSAAVNATGGIPGPGTLSLEIEGDLRCANDPDVAYQLPSGANCVTTSSTTTTTLIPPIPCETLLPPVCGQGTSCPPGEGCVEVGFACACQPTTTTTTTTLPPSCGAGTFPLCGQGTCPPGETCDIDIGGSTCVCTPGTTCADTLFPICGGTCPLGQSCQGDILGGACSCSP